MKRNYRLYVEDILQCVDKIDEFIGSMDFDAFVCDEKTNSAVIRKLEIIGEASKRIPKSITQKYKELPWKDMARMRDKISHDYFGINFKIVWKVIKERLPEIKPLLSEILNEIENSSEKQ